MTTPDTTQPELLLSVARVARLMRVPKEFVRLEIRLNRLRAEAVLIGDRLGVAIPLSGVAERWNLPGASIPQVESEARPCGLKSAVSITSPLVSSVPDVGEATASPTAGSQDLH